MDAADATAEARGRAGAPLLVEARQQALLIAAVRLALAVAGLAGAIARGIDPGPALALLVFGAFAVLLAIYGGDRRHRSALKFGDPKPMPPDARLAGRLRTIAHAAYPSTLGLAALTAIALWPQPGLAALLAGILVGLAAMSLIGLLRLNAWEAHRGTRFFVEPHGSTVFEAPR